MALRKILHYPNTVLRTQAEPILKVDHTITQLVDDMFETMYEARGIGLAAPQIGLSLSLFVIDLAEPHQGKEQHVFINPEILSLEGRAHGQEGCLSVPGIYEGVTRAEKVKVSALDRHGKPFEMEAEDLLAVCIQHEFDHLQGKVFVDYLSHLKRQRIVRKLRKLERITL